MTFNTRTATAVCMLTKLYEYDEKIKNMFEMIEVFYSSFKISGFFMNQFSPQAPEYTIRAVSNFFRKFAEIFAALGALPVSLTPNS